MAKEPAPCFPFCPKDWLSDDRVAVMSMAQRGIYITLLAYSWLEGSLPADVGVVSKMVGGVTTKTILPVLACFEEREGRLYNKRLEHERGKQREVSELQSEKGKLGAAKRWLRPSPPDSRGIAVAIPDDSPRARARLTPLVRTQREEEKPAEARSRQPKFIGQRLKVFEWMLSDLMAMLGSHTDDFLLDEWFYTADAKLLKETAVVTDQWKWLKAQTIEEIKRRGLPMAGASAEDDFFARLPMAWQCKCGEIHEGTQEQGRRKVCLKVTA